MNQRLIAQYSSIEAQNRDKFLQNQLDLDTTWGKSIWGMTLQIDLGEEVKDQIAKYQKDLEELESGNLLLLPRELQHISFNQVVFWGGEYKLGTEGTWNSISEVFLSAFKGLDNLYSPFTVTFSKLIATTGGIIWCATDENDELENLRNEFLAKLPFPPETTKLNHIIHTTIARYKNKLNHPRRVTEYISSHSESVPMKVDQIILKKELVFPTIKTEEIAKISLK